MANIEAQAGDLPDGPYGRAGDLPVVEFSFRLPAIYAILGVAFLFRLILAALDGFEVDIGVFSAWTHSLADDHPWNFYRADYFTDYAPGYMYVLWFIGLIDKLVHFTPDQLEYVLKLPSVAADLASAYVLYLILDKQRQAVRLGASAFYLAFPPALLIGPMWGQVDSALAFLLLLSVYFVGKDRPVAAAAAFTLGFLIKPQAIAALPVLAFWIIRNHPPRLEGGGFQVSPVLWHCLAMGLGLTLLLIIPFFDYEPWRLVTTLYDSTNVENYRVNSFWAFNFWTLQGLFDGGFKPDTQDFLGISHRIWGIVMFVAALAAIIAASWRSRSTGVLALATALSVMAFYTFLTRMHERYVFAAFLPLLVACVMLNSRVLWGTFVVLATVHFLNMYQVFTYPLYNMTGPNYLRIDWLVERLEEDSLLGIGYSTTQILSGIMVACFFVTLTAAFALSWRPPEPEPETESGPEFEFNPT